MSTLTETEIAKLIQASKTGDHQAMSQLIDFYSSSVHKLIYSILRDSQIVEDLAQETFIRMLTSLDHYEFRAPFHAWLYRIAVNLCRDHLRKKKVRHIVGRFKFDEESGAEEEFVDPHQDPTADVQNSEKWQLIENALSRLHDSSRTVFVLREIKDLSYEEIAETLNWKIGTVKSRLFRARRELADLLGPHLEELR